MEMDSVSNRNFGIIIAFLLPGFIAILGPGMYDGHLEGSYALLKNWLGSQVSNDVHPTLASVLLLTLLALFVGMVVSTFRWIIIDSLHHWTGVAKPNWELGKLAQRIDGFEFLVESHYRYYQFHANSLLAIFIHCFFRWQTVNPNRYEVAAILITSLALYLGSRDCLKKYYLRVNGLLAG